MLTRKQEKRRPRLKRSNAHSKPMRELPKIDRKSVREQILLRMS